MIVMAVMVIVLNIMVLELEIGYGCCRGGDGSVECSSRSGNEGDGRSGSRSMVVEVCSSGGGSGGDICLALLVGLYPWA